MARGFTGTKQPADQPQENTTQKVNYQGKTAEDYARFTGQKSMEQRFRTADQLARKNATETLQDTALLEAKYIQQGMADPAYREMVMGHINAGADVYDEVREKIHAAIDSSFAGGEIETENFTNILSGSSSVLQLTGTTD